MTASVKLALAWLMNWPGVDRLLVGLVKAVAEVSTETWFAVMLTLPLTYALALPKYPGSAFREQGESPEIVPALVVTLQTLEAAPRGERTAVIKKAHIQRSHVTNTVSAWLVLL